MRLSMNKEDICEPIEIPKENWDDFLITIIKSSIRRDDMIGENLKQQCIDYIKKQKNNNEIVVQMLESFKDCSILEDDKQQMIDLLK